MRTLSKTVVPVLFALCCTALSHPQAAETVWLDSLDLTNMEQGWGNPQPKRSVTKSPLMINGRAFERGVGTHSISTYALNLAGGTERFEATVGLDNSSSGKGSVVFQLMADGKIVFDSGVIRSNSAAKQVSVDLSGVKTLVMTVADAGDGYQFDHADWADARFIVTGPHPIPVGDGGVDPIAELKVQGRSAHRLARPVKLPFEHVLPGTIT